MSSIFEDLENILISQQRPSEEIEEIAKGFEFANKLHAGQYRISEEPYIIHPVEVAKILADLKADKNTIIAALLHDILEDTDTTPEQIKELFGDDVLKLVQGVTKLGKYQFQSKEERQAENFRRMFIAMSQDVRVIFLKLADRLHNMRTLTYMAAAKQKRIAQETLDIFAPLANRLGMGKIKAELEDLSLRYINPEKYYEIAKLVAQTKADRDKTVKELIQKIDFHLKQNRIKAKLTGRAKHYYSIFNKMRRLNLPFHELYDIVAVRVIVESEKECYEALGVLHSQFKPIVGRFKDYIAMPKSNMYQSLHTSVIGPKGKPIEVQIRTEQMHEIAEFGVAAHWKYKEVGSQKSESQSDLQFSWMRKMIELENDAQNAKDYVDSVILDVFSDQVFAFTPMGDVIDLPNNATPVDFAYRVHSEVGHKTVGALVNGRIVPLDTKLKNGDIVEVLTSKNPSPKRDWLNFVVTKGAVSKIRQWFKKYNREDNINLGRSNLEAELTKTVFDEMVKEGEFERVALEMNYKSAQDLFAAVGYGETTAHKVVNKVKKPEPKPDIKLSSTGRRQSEKDIVGLEGLMYSLAKCCSPVPGEPIVGVVTRIKGVVVHRLDCKCIQDVAQARMLSIKWFSDRGSKAYSVNLRVEAQDRIGLLKDIITKVSDTNTNISYATTHSKDKKLGIINLGIELDGIESLKKVIANLQSLSDVYSVRRVQNTSLSVNSAKSKKKNAKNR